MPCDFKAGRFTDDPAQYSMHPLVRGREGNRLSAMSRNTIHGRSQVNDLVKPGYLIGVYPCVTRADSERGGGGGGSIRLPGNLAREDTPSSAAGRRPQISVACLGAWPGG